MLDQDFQNATKYVAETKSMKVTNDQKLSFYKYYKQATVGDCNTERPGFYKLEEKAKWDSWNSVKGMSSDAAKEAYVNLLTSIQPSWRG
ncbi:acyl CoA binding protein, putative [Theileria equi strain WA]|uniref:Acyl CoA binding protein, putative n=1 Tax=Theileria equi strain WA TaxID=1537102 RepID=L0AYD1_THEEQ|nr:acyl CoA binding protein, putative [Theileria equi strain WA]AFZ80575.1 acyl CoA binding protein, putative [Theileria equi strain WA]|eukprot:XP_004830241.1 acyl CoA binding protein, putative [Theileria equi strain WA]